MFKQVFGEDGLLLRVFYDFVQKEEMLLDEIDMPEEAFHQK
jgi:hypothetical protein